MNVSATCSYTRLFITHVDAFGPYLKISGHLNPDWINVVRNKVQEIIPTCYAIDPNLPLASQHVLLLPDTICLYKRRSSGISLSEFDFLRARICSVVKGGSVAMASGLQVELDFIDYGYTVTVSAYELLFPQCPQSLENLAPLCTQYILLGICTEWKKSELDEVFRMIIHKTVDICIEMEISQYKFITMKWKEFNFSEFLIHQKKIGAPITKNLLRDSFLKLLKQQQQLHQPRMTINNNDNNIVVNNNNNFQSSHNKVKTTTAAYVGGSGSPSCPTMPAGGNNGAPPVTHRVVNANEINNHIVMRRSLSARLQQHQGQQHMSLHRVMPHVQPRMPHTIGNLRSMGQGCFHFPTNRLPYITHHHLYTSISQPVPFSNTTSFLQNNMATATSMTSLNTYNARYQRPIQTEPIQQLIKTPPTRQKRSMAAFRSNNLTVGMIYDVCVSFVENGPCLFSVQSINSQNELTEMMNQIENMQLQQFSNKPVPGTACVARYSEDGQLYRALITGVQPTACKVAYIDYGNAEVVNYHDLYEIPDEFLSAKAYAIRFTLSGHKDLEPIDESLKKAFKDLVIYKKCKLHVMPLEGPPLVQYCELFLQDKNVLDILKQIQKSRLVYAKADTLQNNDIVEIRYIDSPKHFYVQKAINIEKFEKLMDDMFLYYNKNQMVPNRLTLGAPCIVKYDNEWYRAEVMRADATAIVVRHVDFGYEQMVTKNLLSTIAEKHLKLPRQAIQCCLKGFENNELSKDLATTQFEMLAEESNRKRRSFTVKVFRIQPDGVNLVNLCTKELNVMKKLYKLSMPFEQYISLEKEDFSMSETYFKKDFSKREKTNGNDENDDIVVYKTIFSNAPSHEVAPLHSSGKIDGNILNSTAITSSISRQPSNIKKSPQQQKGLLDKTIQMSTPATGEWDQNSSASDSIDNRDSRSSSSEHKHNKRNQHQHQYRHRNQEKQGSSSGNSDRRSNGSNGSGSGGQINKQWPTLNIDNIPPRFQRQLQEYENRCNQKQISNVVPQLEQQGGRQRPQNAPQGFSQQRHKIGKSGYSTNSSSAEKSSSNELQQQQSDIIYMSFDHAFPRQHIETPTREEVTICWWISPHQFYTHLKSRIPDFERLMRSMQEFYKDRKYEHIQLKIGSYVVARFRKDNIVYRARIMACNQMLRKYKVLFIDFGSQYTVSNEDIWQVEERFATFPCMAYLCSFNGIISNVDHLHIIDRMEKYLPIGSKLTCEYIERLKQESEYSLYYVNISVNGMSLRETLKLDGLITEVCPELRLDLLAGQQIRAKICSITDMLNFKIQIEGCNDQIKFLCSYSDVRYVKSNPDVAKKFKRFYENKSCVVNIVDITDNKVILLRPMLPLLKADIPTYVCTYPIILESFEGRVIYVASSYRLYVHISTCEREVSSLLNEMYQHYESSENGIGSFEPDTLCAVNSCDGNWYRARIVTCCTNQPGSTVKVYYIDYGNIESVERSKLKPLEEKFYMNKSAFAVEVNLPIKPPEMDKNVEIKLQDASEKVISSEEKRVLEELKLLALDQTVTIKAIEVRNNRLIADVFQDGLCLVNVLKEKSLIKGKDLESIRRVIDKQKPNIVEYIEMVDLTIEDEDEEMYSINKIEEKCYKEHSEEEGRKEGVTNNKTSKFEYYSPRKLKSQDKMKHESELKKLNGQELNRKHQESTHVEEEKEKKKTKMRKDETKDEGEVFEATSETENLDVKESTPQSLTPSPGKEKEKRKLEDSKDPYDGMEHAVLSHCDNPTRFFIHPQHKLNELRQLQENLQIVASSLPPLMNVMKGAYCISHYSVDKQWYRAKIMDAELMIIQFIDYGHTDALTDTTDIKEMSIFPDIEPLCLPCALPIKPNGTADWVDAANTIFNDSYQKVLHYEYITRGDYVRKSFIRLIIDGVDVAEKLLKDGFAKPLQTIKSGENCYISHVNSITDFYIQYEKDTKALELIEIYLAEKDKIQKIAKFESNKVVAAIFPDDDMWYRARVLRQLPNRGYEVIFIDYGNTCNSPECREISEDIAALPALSQKCALELPSHCAAWSDHAERKFLEISAFGETIFTVELREPMPEYCVVQLFIDGHNIVDQLASLCEQKTETSTQIDVMYASFSTSAMQSSVCEVGSTLDAIISHANSPEDFYIQFKKDAERLEDMTFTLNSLVMEPLQKFELGNLCAAVFEEDGALYRARIIELDTEGSKEYRVLFIDFGNEAVSRDLRTLPEDLFQLKPFAKHCRVESISSGANALTTEIFNVLIDECQGLVKVEIIGSSDMHDDDNSDVPAVVRVFASNTGQNLYDKLNRLLTESKPKEKTCIITHATSPRQFYIQLKSNSTKMEVLSKALQNENVRKTMPLLQMPEVECVCSVYSIDDDCYYRGHVNQVLDPGRGYIVFLVDYGFVINSTELRELTDELRAIPALAVKCQLADLPDGVADSVLDDHFSALMEAHFGEIFEIEDDVLDAINTRLHTVKLRTSNYEDLSEELRHAVVNGSTHVKVLSPVPMLHNCNVIHANSPSSFYVQLAADVAEVEHITDVLLDAESDFPPFVNLVEGAICAAQFPDDMAFYRARILRVLNKELCKCEVHYLDFGNNAVTDQFRQLPTELFKVAGYSKHCTLEKCQEMGFNSPEAIAHFQNLIESRFSETFQIELLNTKLEPIICRLFYQDKNVVTVLQQLLKIGNNNGGGVGGEETQKIDVWEERKNDSNIRNHPYDGKCNKMEGEEEGAQVAI